MAKIYLGSPIYSLTPAEERELNERAIKNSVLDADVQDTIDAPLGRMEIGARNSMFGGTIGRAVPYLVDVFDGGYSAPLNLTRKKSEADPIKDDFSLFNGNDPETIAEEMRNVPEDEWPWVLSSGDYNTYRRRLRYVLTAQPEAQQQGSMAGFALGLSADISAMVATGVAAEGVALAGFNTASLAGRAGAASLGIGRTQRIAAAVAEATNAVSRTNLAMRWTALGAGENLMWEVAHQGLDPTYDPTFGDVAETTAYSAVFSGALGGAVFGRQFVRDRVTEMVLDLRRKRVTNLPGGYTISYTDGFLFDAPAAADQMLFAPGTGSFQYEAERIAGDLWTDWQRSPKTVDLFLPGTRSVSLPVLDEAAAARLTGGFDIGDALIPSTAAARSMPSGQPAQLFGWNAQWALAAAARQQGIDLSTLSREQYAQFAITNGFRITDDQLRMAPSLRRAASMDEYQAIRKATRPGTPEQAAADRAFTSFADEIIRDASSSKELFNGVRIRSGTANSNTWLFFKVNSGAPQAGDTYKAYAGFDNPYKALTPKKVRQFLKFLQSRGYNGDVKTIQDLDLGSSISDQIVMHGATEADAKLGQKLSREFFGDDLTFSELGIDKGGKSYSQILSDTIESEINLRAAAARTAGTPVVQAPTVPAVTSGIPINRVGLENRKWLENTVAVRAGERGFESGTPYPQARAAANREREMAQANLTESPVPLMGPTVFRETGSDSAFNLLSRIEQGPRTHEPFFVSDNPDLALSQDKKGVFIEFDASLINGRLNRAKPLANEVRAGQGTEFTIDKTLVGSVKSLTFENKKTFERFRKQFADRFDFDNPETTERGLKVVRKPTAKTSKVAAKGEEPIFAKPPAAAAVPEIPTVQAPKATGEVRDALGRIPARPKMGQVVGLRSAIKATAFELSLAGQKLDAKVFSTIAKALVRAEKTRTRAGAFNKVFWEELSKDLDPEVVNNLRKVGERTFIPGIDRSVIDLSQRDDMVDAVLEGFRAKQHLVKGEEPSLIFRVLQQIKDRNGLVTRKVVEDVVDELRKVSQNPPKTLNAKGAEILDRNARRAAIVQIINKHSKSDKAIFLPPSLLNNMNPAVAAAKGANRITRLGTADPLGTAQDASDVPRNKVRLPFGLGQMFNQSAVAHESNNGWARLVANLSFFARRDMGTAQQYTIFEEGSHKMYSLMGMFVKGYRNGFIKFALGNGTEDVTRQVGLSDALVTAFKDNKMTREYNRRVLQQLRTGAYDDALPAVNDGARGIREMFNRVHELAHAAGLPGFTKAAVNNYFPRMWRWDKIRRLATTKEGRAALESLIRQSIDQNGRRVIIDGVETAFEGDIDDAAKAFSERLIAIAEGTENAPLVQQEQELFDAITRLEGPLKAKVGSKTPYGRSRMLLNESSEVTSGDLLGAGKNTLSIADLTNDDLPFVVRKYITSVMGAVNEKRLLDAFNAEMKARGILKPTTVKNGEEVAEDLTVDSVDKMLAMVKKLGGTLEAKHESALREIIAAMRYEPIHHGRTATTDRIMSILMPYGYLTTGGQFGLAQIGEIARIVGTLGVSNTIKQMPILMEMISNWKNLDQDTKGMSVFLNQWFSPSTDRLRRTMVQGLSDMQPDDYGSLVARGTTATARYLDKAANLMSDVSLLAPFQSFTQQLTAAATLQHMMEAARGATKWLDDSTVRTLGLEPEQYRALAKWVSDNAEEANGRIVGISKPDAVEMDKLVKLVDRMVRTRIQDIPTRGDFAKGMFSALGRMMLQFRTFNLKGVDNFLLQNSSRVVSGAPGAKAKVASEIGATLVIAGSIQWLRNAADWSSYKASGDTEKADEIEERMTWDGFARGAMTGPSEFFVPIMLTDAFTQTFVSKDPIFSPYRYSGLSLYSFPSFALAKRAAGLGTDIYGSTVGQALGLDLEREVTQSTIHKARLLMPFQNLIGLKQYFNILEQDIVDYYNLPEIQPRNRE